MSRRVGLTFSVSIYIVSIYRIYLSYLSLVSIYLSISIYSSLFIYYSDSDSYVCVTSPRCYKSRLSDVTLARRSCVMGVPLRASAAAAASPAVEERDDHGVVVLPTHSQPLPSKTELSLSEL